VTLNCVEASKNGKEFTDIISKKIGTLKSRCTVYGYIIDIIRVVDIGYGVARRAHFDGSVNYNVIIECTLFDPKPGDIIVGCILKKKSDVGLQLAYGPVTVFVEFKGSELETPDKLSKYVVGSMYNVKCLSVREGIDRPSYELMIRKETDLGRKIHSRNEFVPAKKIISDRGEYERWFKFKPDILKDKKFEYISFDNKKEEIDYKYLLRIDTYRQMFVVGEIFVLWDIPFNYRYISYEQGDEHEMIFNVKFFSTYNANDHNIYGQDERVYKKKLDVDLYKNGDWDKYGKFLINPYEMVYPDAEYSVKGDIWKLYAPKKPVSRAYFKAYEIIKVFDLKVFDLKVFDLKDNNQLLVTLGDAPGGFAQVLSHQFPGRKIVTVSLVKGIKYNQVIMKEKNILIDKLALGDGDLLNLDNIKDMINRYKDKCSLIMCDGALKYENPNVSKEVQHFKLFLAQSIISLGICADGGSFCVKLYHRYTQATMELFYWLSQFFEGFVIYKPKSVRIANTEVFMLCYKKKNKININLSKIYIMLNEVLSKDKWVHNLFDIKVPAEFAGRIVKYNKILNQVELFTHEYGHEILKKYKVLSVMKKMAYPEQLHYSRNKFDV
jgi:23S rRNA U2552 (ribose-2'-O)-methylase RlmE/FtsJ